MKLGLYTSKEILETYSVKHCVHNLLIDCLFLFILFVAILALSWFFPDLGDQIDLASPELCTFSMVCGFFFLYVGYMSADIFKLVKVVKRDLSSPED